MQHLPELRAILPLLDPFLLVTALCFLLKQKLARKYPALLAFLSFRLASWALIYAILAHQNTLPYSYYFYTYWISNLIEAGLTLWCVGQMFSIALSPLAGIRRLATSAVGCICALSLIIAATMTVSSYTEGAVHMTSTRLLVQIVSEVTRFESVLVLCMLVFLAFASHMLGLSYKSRIFSISFGFGFGAMVNLLVAALAAKNAAMTNGLAIWLATIASLPLLVWNLAIMLPEPARRLITVPVDSWMLRWNDIAKSFGHGPAAVVVGEDPLQMMHPNEVLMHQHVMNRRAPANALPQTTHS